MKTIKRLGVSAAFAGLLSLALVSSVFAHACFPVDKAAGAGSIGVYNLTAGTFTPAKHNPGDFNNGGFVTLTDGANFSYDVFLHQYLPEGALASGPAGDDHCDGRGVDEALTCLGILH